MVARRMLVHDFFGADWQRAKELLATKQSSDDIGPLKVSLARGPDLGLPSRTSFNMDGEGYLGQVLEGSRDGYFYARAGTPQERVLCDRLVEAEAGYFADEGDPFDFIDATVFPSGMAAIYGVAKALARNIEHSNREHIDLFFMRGKTVFVNTEAVFDEVIPQETCINKALAVDTTNLAEVYKALQERGRQTIALFYEGVTNPLIEVTDTRKVARMAQEHGIPVIVDNTFLTPYLQQPFRMGADIVIHSMTKYISGHGDVLGGAVIGPKDFIRHLRAWQTVTGSVIDQTVAETLYHRLADLPQRMRDHTNNAYGLVTRFLQDSPHVDTVHYPDLGDLSRDGLAGGVVTFELAGKTAKEKLAREKEFIARVESDVRSPISYQVSLGDERYLMIGESTLGIPSDYPPGTIRLAVGRIPDHTVVAKFLQETFEAMYNSE